MLQGNHKHVTWSMFNVATTTALEAEDGFSQGRTGLVVANKSRGYAPVLWRLNVTYGGTVTNKSGCIAWTKDRVRLITLQVALRC